MTRGKWLGIVAVLAAAFMFGMVTSGARADGSWLDEPQPVQWNMPRMALPPGRAGLDENINERCLDSHRPAETDEDEELVKAGYFLVGSYTSGWGVRMVTAASSFDGMCRPLGYNIFVFANGIFAGTVAPAAMDSRTDGAAGQASLVGGDRIFVTFTRYAASDPLCCPSRLSSVSYTIDRGQGAPVLRAENVSTHSTS